MKDTQLYSQILGIEKPWKVIDVQVSLADDEVEVTVDHASLLRQTMDEVRQEAGLQPIKGA